MLNSRHSPVAQLGRLPIPPDSKSSKKRIDLLDAIDTLSCHLYSTFSALSSSLALNSLKYPHKSGHAQVHLLILLGPSLFGPRSRLLLTIDGLTVQAWNYGTDGEALSHCKDENQCNGRNAGGRPDRVRTTDQVRSPLSSIPLPATNVLHKKNPTSPERTSLDSTKSSGPPSPSDKSLVGYSGEQQALSAAERLLSRSLATACAEDGATLNVELGPNPSSTLKCSSLNADLMLEPTQMHVLIQAPRRFHHPAWVPRQNMSPGLDLVLGGVRGHEEVAMKGRTSVKTDGVIIRCDYAKVSEVMSDNPGSVEADDLIWWSWEGKIVGFGDS